MTCEMRDIVLSKIMETHPYAADFFTGYGIRNVDGSKTFNEILAGLRDDFCEDKGIDRDKLPALFESFIEKMESLSRTGPKMIGSLTVIGGHDKAGMKEDAVLTLKPGEIYCIVGPTGSGKSRLLADIECLAQKDTPTGREVLLNGKNPGFDERFSSSGKIVAQLSQNMNFVMDLSARDFVRMHAESRMTVDIDGTVTSILGCANDLAGEKFDFETPLTQLSGGQSRALMIADTALLSVSPVILIDEIENAGVDRKKALELLVKKEKIVLMSTHDPILALMGDKRIVIRNGGINRIIDTSDEERLNLAGLQKIDSKLGEIRNLLRKGENINFDMNDFFMK
jgi:ABC-type lipoprotein export system ATPase subunit